MDSAVGLIIHSDSIVIVKRQRREGDPWSGDIAFPGGHVKEGETAVQGVLREIREEVSLSFRPDDIVMELPPTHSMRMPEMPVYPFVIAAESLEGLAPGPEIYKIRVVGINSGLRIKHPVNGQDALDFDGWIMWGLTYRIFMQFLSVKEDLGKSL